MCPNYSSTPTARLSTRRHQIQTSEIDPRTVRVKIFLMTVDT